MLRVLGFNGEFRHVTDRLGVPYISREDIMMELGYSKMTWLEKYIPVGQVAVIKVTVPTGITHHAELRFLEVDFSNIRVRVLNNALDSEFPAIIKPLDFVNRSEKFPANQLTEFYDCGTVTSGSEPSTGDLQSNFRLLVSSGVPASTSPAQSTSVRGRISSSGTKAVLIENIGGDPATVYYQYEFHEYEE